MINHILINSKKVAVYVPSNSFSNELVEIESIAQKLGQYGNILGFQVKKGENKTAVIFSLQEDFSSFKTSSVDATSTNTSAPLNKGDKYFDPNTKQVYEVVEDTPNTTGTSIVQVKQNNSMETQSIDKNNFLSSTQKVENIM